MPHPVSDPDGAIPLEALAVDLPALGAGCRLRALAPDPRALQEAMDGAVELLGDLDRAWGDGGDLGRLAASPVGAGVPVSWDTVLLLGRDQSVGIEVDIGGHTATRTGAVELPSVDARHALAAELALAELMDGGCLVAEVDVGAFRSSANRGIREDWAGR